jgi:hypothetical protein
MLRLSMGAGGGEINRTGGEIAAQTKQYLI